MFEFLTGLVVVLGITSVILSLKNREVKRDRDFYRDSYKLLDKQNDQLDTDNTQLQLRIDELDSRIDSLKKTINADREMIIDMEDAKKVADAEKAEADAKIETLEDMIRIIVGAFKLQKAKNVKAK